MSHDNSLDEKRTIEEVIQEAMGDIKREKDPISDKEFDPQVCMCPCQCSYDCYSPDNQRGSSLKDNLCNACDEGKHENTLLGYIGKEKLIQLYSEIMAELLCPE